MAEMAEVMRTEDVFELMDYAGATPAQALKTLKAGSRDTTSVTADGKLMCIFGHWCIYTVVAQYGGSTVIREVSRSSSPHQLFDASLPPLSHMCRCHLCVAPDSTYHIAVCLPALLRCVVLCLRGAPAHTIAIAAVVHCVHSAARSPTRLRPISPRRGAPGRHSESPLAGSAGRIF